MSEIKKVLHEVPHHFESADQEFETCKIGMWAFIAQEILFFSGIFVAYGMYRFLHPEMFVEAASYLSWKMGALNTIVLIISSFTIVMAVYSAQHNKIKHCLRYLYTTFGLAAAFLVVKGFEYASKIEHGYLPYRFFQGEGVAENLHVFFGIYFAATGLHAVHVLIGMGLILWVVFAVKKSGNLSS